MNDPATPLNLGILGTSPPVLQASYCPFSCCRTNVVRTLFTKPGYTAVLKAGVEVSVSGIMDEEERGYIVAWRTRGASGKEKDESIAHTQFTMKRFRPLRASDYYL